MSPEFEKNTIEIIMCNKCELAKSVINKVVWRGTSENPDIVFVGEAPGNSEDICGTPFVGRSGKELDKMIEYMELENYAIINRLKCFVSSKVMVYTSEGYKFIRDVQIGDSVLTHRGRFRRVLSRIHDLPKEERINTELLYKIKTHHKTYVLPTSHRFLSTSNEWIEVGNLKRGDKIKVLGEKCVVCGEIYWKNPAFFDSVESTCSPRCHNVLLSKKPLFREAISKSLIKSYQEGTRDRFETTKKANEATRDNTKKGTFHLLSANTNSEHRRNQRLSASKSIQGFNEMKLKGTSIGLGEIELSNWLINEKIDFVSQFSIENRNYDFFLPEHNLIIEIENPNTVTQKIRVDRRTAKEELVNSITEYDIVYVHSNNVIEEVERILRNHDGDYHFCETEIIEITEHHPNKNLYLYSLEVEEDQSFVAGGIVHHNCRPPSNANPTPAQLEACHPYLLRQIELLNPALIVLLGKYANDGYGPAMNFGDITEEGDRFYAKLYHPAFLLYRPQFKPKQYEFLDKITKMMPFKL